MTPHEFADLYSGLQQLQESGFSGGAALATLVHTRGPVFRRPGARMLVFGDGRVVRGLSAGCPEADIIERSRDVIATGQARLLRYDREHGYDALMELGCGGEMEVLLEPLRAAGQLRFAEVVTQSLRQRSQGLLMTVFSQDGQCLPQPRRLVWGGSVLLDELDDPQLSDTLLSGVAPEDSLPATRLERVATPGGEFQVLVERLRPPLRLVLVGINTTALALARLARGLGWQVCLVDHREDSVLSGLPAGVDLLHAQPQNLAQQIAPDTRTAVVVMTHNLERDLACLQALRAVRLAYLGALGSRSRAAKMREAAGVTTAPLHAPAGLDIGSETPEEIALAIAAEIQAAASGHGGGRLSAGDGPIH
ncbi:XdhC family protein [Solimonas sp. K1W22B-7]|uniref:XdhC family protein n=1 Tax=Solimonas sp. K1W22B-7 TaxID=2303331 RepID=UPI0013C5128E|nr:XdhC/CoxI family protein [Solimonas sp. K1W22B-7]